MEESLELLKRASFEIQMLRNQNAIMNARLTMFDNCMLLLNAKKPESNMGMTEDVVSQIDRFVQSNNK